MVVHDTDDEAAAGELARRIDEEDLLGRDLISTFGPDTLAEATNRGFRPG